jgi:cytochrome b6-f complex iron-sulfur subunit
MRGVTRFVEDLIRSRRPRRFRASPDDAEMVRAAITLRAARPDSEVPRDEFIAALRQRLAGEFDRPAPRRLGARRRFLAAASVAAGAAAAGAGIDHVLTGRPSGQRQATLRPDHGSWQTVAASADLPAGGGVRRFNLGVVIGFVEREGGLLRAVSGVCTHQGCRLALAAPATHLVCPCHGATFALDGVVLTHRLPISLSPLPRLPVREIDGTIQVYAPDPE